METYIFAYRSRFGTLRFSAMTSPKTRPVVRYGPDSRGSAAGAWRKRLKHWCVSGLLESLAASVEMNLTMMRCSEDDSYQGLLTLLLADVHRCSDVPIVVSHEQLALFVKFGHLYYVESRMY